MILNVHRALQAKLLKPGLELAGEQAILYSKWCGAPEIPRETVLNLHLTQCQEPDPKYR